MTKLNSIQYLRGLASIMVVLYHIGLIAQRKYSTSFSFETGMGGGRSLFCHKWIYYVFYAL